MIHRYFGPCQLQTQNITNKSTSARLLEMSFQKRLQELGEGLKQAAVNQSIIMLSLNSGMARLMFNLRCSLLALHVHPVLYYARDIKVQASSLRDIPAILFPMLELVFHTCFSQIFTHLVDVLKEPFVLYNDSAYHIEKLELYHEGTYNKQIHQRIPVWIWILRDLGLSFWYPFMF